MFGAYLNSVIHGFVKIGWLLEQYSRFCFYTFCYYMQLNWWNQFPVGFANMFKSTFFQWLVLCLYLSAKLVFSLWWFSLCLLVECRSSLTDWPGDYSLHPPSTESSHTTVDSWWYELKRTTRGTRGKYAWASILSFYVICVFSSASYGWTPPQISFIINDDLILVDVPPFTPRLLTMTK